MKTLLLILVGLSLIALVGFVILGVLSRSGEPLGLAEGRLAPCPQKPNCVCSEFEDKTHFIQPIIIPNTSKRPLLPTLKAVIQDMQGTLEGA